MNSLTFSALAAFIISVQVLGIKAMAEPTLYPENLNTLSKIVNTTNSNLLADEVDSGTIWVMPPNTASAIVTGLHTKTSNMGLCAEMRDLNDYSRQLSHDMRDLMQQKKAKLADLMALQKKANELNEEAQAFAAEKDLMALSDLDSRIATSEQRLTDLYKVSETCQPETCDKINQEIDSLITSKKEMLKQRNTLASKNADDVRVYNQKLKKAQAAMKTYSDANGVFIAFDTELRDVQNKFRQSSEYYGRLEGARASIKYVSSWDANIDSLRRMNPGINFSKIKTQKAVLMTAISGLDAFDKDGAIKAIELGGELQKGKVEYSAYPESLSANIVLSLIGACPMEHPEYFDIKTNSADEMNYGIVIAYDYQSIFKMKASATYNMHKVYQKIVSGGSSGGFFSSRSWSNVEEKNFFSDSMTIQWNDKEGTVSADEKDRRELEMRHSILMRLADLALPDTQTKGDVLLAANPGPHGAVVLAEALVKTCPTNIYCQGGAIVMNVLDAIFGNSSSAASYTKITDSNITENYEADQKITKSWITSYL